MKGNGSWRWLAAAALALAPAIGWSQMVVATPGSGLAGTDHDFTGGGTVTATTAVGVCTFCHTPHKASSTLLLWNHTLSANSFSWDVPTTTAGTLLPTISGATYKGTSAKCLSCHDGSVAIGDIGWFNEAAHNGASNLTGGTVVDANHLIGPGGAMKGNHPVAIPYPYGQVANTYNGITGGGQLTLNEWQANPGSLTQASIRLFKDDGTGNMSALVPGATSTAAGIECSSCHDPHNKAAKDDKFLRGMMTGNTQASGYLCLQCHIK